MPTHHQKSKTDPLHKDLAPVTDKDAEQKELDAAAEAEASEAKEKEAKAAKAKKPLTGIEKVKAELLKESELCHLDWQPVAEAKEFNISSTRGLLKWPKDGGLVTLNHEDGNAAVKLLSGWRPNDGIRLVPVK
jgi:septal ring factor EnvC (AmiA/AmiB activator)